jgi:hypothetical protein
MVLGILHFGKPPYTLWIPMALWLLTLPPHVPHGLVAPDAKSAIETANTGRLKAATNLI